MTRDEFFDWAEAQHARYEFDGFQPVAMTGGNLNHSRITSNIYIALRSRLKGKSCEPFGDNAGVATIDDKVRYPDASVTCSRTVGTSLLVPDPIVIFEVISPGSGHVDRIVKLREYAAVPSIRRYLIVESASIGLTDHRRAAGVLDWTASPLAAGGTLHLPEIGVEIPVEEIYEGTDLPPS